MTPDLSVEFEYDAENGLVALTFTQDADNLLLIKWKLDDFKEFGNCIVKFIKEINLQQIQDYQQKIGQNGQTLLDAPKS
jgi:hypothetical protein